MINNMKRVPVCLMSTLVITLMFFFVDYAWWEDIFIRGFYCCVVVAVGAMATAINGDTKFWVHKP